MGTNRDQWHGLVFGMVCRIYPDPHTCDPRPLYKALDALGLARPAMFGWWDGRSPVAVAAPGVRATLFLTPSGRAAIALANWGSEPVETTISLDLGKLRALAAL